MTAELRTIGDKVAVYTDDQLLYRRLREGQTPLYKIPYLKGGKMVGVDLYFDKKFKEIIGRMVEGQMPLGI